MQQPVVSLVTVCTNRLHHLQQTLPRNIADHESMDGVEFVVLDYNSTDGLAGWISSEMQPYLQNGRLRYYHTPEPACYHPTHARNMAFLLSKGRLICNVDADNFTGYHFADYLNERFCENEKSVVITFGGRKRIAPTDTYGRICVTRADFLAVNGYDESFDKYGGEDIDFAKRVMHLGRRTVIIEEERFLQRIMHDDAERTAHMALLKTITAAYLTTDPAGFSRVLFLFHDARFVLVSMIGHGQKMEAEWQDNTDEGYYEWKDKDLHLSFHQGFQWRLSHSSPGNMLSLFSRPDAPLFYEIATQHHIATWALQYMMKNMKIMPHGAITVNTGGFGAGTVFFNFNYSKPLPVGVLRDREAAGNQLSYL